MDAATRYLPASVVRAVGPLRSAALKHSRALIDSDKKLMVFWSPKSACTAAYIWFACVSGFVGEVRKSGLSPHQHRRMHYQKSGRYLQSLSMSPHNSHVLRVIRDPYARTVSIYRHTLKFEFSDPMIDAFFQGRRRRVTGISFIEFLDFLEAQIAVKSNPHFMPQYHAEERVFPPTHVINCSNGDVLRQLDAVAESLALPRVDFASLDWYLKFEKSRSVDQSDVANGFADEIAFDQAAALGRKPFPAHTQFMSETARRKIERLFAVDFEQYRSSL